MYISHTRCRIVYKPYKILNHRMHTLLTLSNSKSLLENCWNKHRRNAKSEMKLWTSKNAIENIEATIAKQRHYQLLMSDYEQSSGLDGLCSGKQRHLGLVNFRFCLRVFFFYKCYQEKSLKVEEKKTHRQPVYSVVSSKIKKKINHLSESWLACELSSVWLTHVWVLTHVRFLLKT